MANYQEEGKAAEQVKEAIKRMKQELRKYHDEIGE